MNATFARATALAAAMTIGAGILPAEASLLANGDFETNTAGTTRFNVSNPQFTGFMASATDFGTSEELDIVTGTDFGIAPGAGTGRSGCIRTPATPPIATPSRSPSSPAA